MGAHNAPRREQLLQLQLNARVNELFSSLYQQGRSHYVAPRPAFVAPYCLLLTTSIVFILSVLCH